MTTIGIASAPAPSVIGVAEKWAKPFGLKAPLAESQWDESTGEEAHHPVGRVRILLVEDNPADVKIIARALRESRIPFDLHVVSDGEQALTYLQKAGGEDNPAPSVILLDWNLPRVSGWDVLAYIRQNQRLRRIPVVVVTSTDAPEDVREMRRLGADGHFRKPADLDAFLDLKSIVLDLLLKRPRPPS